MIMNPSEAVEAWTKSSKTAFDFWVSFWPVAPMFGVEWRFANAMPRFNPRVLEDVAAETRDPEQQGMRKSARAALKAVALPDPPADVPAKAASEAVDAITRQTAAASRAGVETAKMMRNAVEETIASTRAAVGTEAPAIEEPRTVDPAESATESASSRVEATPVPEDAEESAAELIETAGSSERGDEGAVATERPKGLHRKPPASPDDLKRIKGVGPSLEKQLNGLGIYSFEQIAAFSDANLAWIDENLTTFKGRCFRDDWVGQAKSMLG